MFVEVLLKLLVSKINIKLLKTINLKNKEFTYMYMYNDLNLKILEAENIQDSSCGKVSLPADSYINFL